MRYIMQKIFNDTYKTHKTHYHSITLILPCAPINTCCRSCRIDTHGVIQNRPLQISGKQMFGALHIVCCIAHSIPNSMFVFGRDEWIHWWVYWWVDKEVVNYIKEERTGRLRTHIMRDFDSMKPIDAYIWYIYMYVRMCVSVCLCVCANYVISGSEYGLSPVWSHFLNQWRNSIDWERRSVKLK